MSLYSELVEAGVEIDNHKSDLYCQVSEESTAVLARHPCLAKSTFIDQRTGTLWYDIPFMFEPWWRKRQ